MTRRDSFSAFMARVETSDGCWRWIGNISSQGYGRWRGTQAHRWIYEHLHGAVPKQLTMDHLCRNRWCVNPTHVEPVSNRENLLRSPFTLPSIAMAKIACARAGHPLTGDNVGIDHKGWRFCRECRRQRWMKWWNSQPRDKKRADWLKDHYRRRSRAALDEPVREGEVMP